MSEEKDYEKVILYDLEALKDCFISRNKKDFDYHFRLLKGNLKDYSKQKEKGEPYGNRSA